MAVQLDQALLQVAAHLQSKPALAQLVANAIRQAFDEVIDGARTGRYRLEELEKTEKTYIGTKVEIILRDVLELPRGAVLDNLIHGHEVDTKFTVRNNWMIPREAVDQLCLLVKGNDNSGIYSLGLVRADNAVLSTGTNQDGKRSISAQGMGRVHWLLRDQPMIRNFLLDLDDATRSRILSKPNGTQRIRTLFREVIGQIIPRSAILQVGRLDDPLKRAREAKTLLAREGIQVLCAAYANERAIFIQNGFANPNDDDWLSLRSP